MARPDAVGNTMRWVIAVPAIAAIAIAVPTFGAAVEREHETPAQLVDALHSAFGEHHARAVHAKGVVLEGRFEPAPDARSITRAALFVEKSVPLTVRFSDFTGIPDIPDTIPEANPRGLAMKFHAKNGDMDVVTHSFNGFPTANSDDFAEFLRAVGASGAGASKPTPIELFLAAHPVAKTFLETQKPPPESYATAAYFGVNAFAFVDAQGHTSYVRYRFVPKAGEHYLDAAALSGKGPTYLIDEIPMRTAKAAVEFDWYAQVAGPGDVIDNPSVAWPESRRLVKLGTLIVDRTVADQVAANKSLLFLPSRVPAGITPADPMITIRAASYPISFGARQ